MTSEQAEGKKVDARSDIFSFGSLLYEMVTGQRAFLGQSKMSVLAAILREEPKPVSEIRAEVPVELQRVIGRCLRKEPERRFQHIADVKVALLELQEESESGQQSRPASSTVKVRRHWLFPTVATVVACLLVGAAIEWRSNHKTKADPTPSTFQNMRITRLTATGKAHHVALSPDAKYLTYATTEAGQQSLWLRQIATGSDIQIAQKGPVEYWQLIYSPDGNHLYYTMREKNSTVSSLYYAPALGGFSTKLISDAWTISIATKTGKLLFSRDDPERKECQLLLSEPDGSSQRKVASRPFPQHYYYATISPDGKTVAAAIRGGSDVARIPLVAIRTSDGREQPLSSRTWVDVRGWAWLPDGSEIIMAATDEVGRPPQIWQLTYPGGNARRVTNDLNRYSSISLAADGKNLLTVQAEQDAHIWLTRDGRQSWKRLTSGTGIFLSPVWTPDGRIVYASQASGAEGIWIIDADGTVRRRLTANPEGDVDPTVPPDGRVVAFCSYHHANLNIWTVGVSGGDLKQITSDGLSFGPQWSADGNWVVFSTEVSGKSVIRRMPVKGGAPVDITDRCQGPAAVSPDGSLIACHSVDEEVGLPTKIMVFPMSGEHRLKVFRTPSPDWFFIRWTADGRALSYVSTLLLGASDLWVQSIAGGPAKKLISVAPDMLFSFAWSRNGSLVCSRGSVNTNVVLISGFR